MTDIPQIPKAVEIGKRHVFETFVPELFRNDAEHDYDVA